LGQKTPFKIKMGGTPYSELGGIGLEKSYKRDGEMEKFNGQKVG